MHIKKTKGFPPTDHHPEEKKMTNRPLSVNVNLGFMLLNALIWLILGIIISLNAHPALPDLPAMKISLVVLSVVIAIILLALTYFLGRQNRTAFYLALVFFVFTCLLTIFDH